jgi:putative SbcD/Mre11-related phosphoesterase
MTMLVHNDWLLTPARAAIHLPTGTAVVADLHLGYEEARRRSGEAIPQRCLSEVLAPLAALCRTHALRRLVIAGDLFEAREQPKLVEELCDWFADTGFSLVGVVPGNHDRGLGRNRKTLPLFPEGLRLDDWLVLHGHGSLPEGHLITGHEHPLFRWDDLAAPCFLVGQRRLVLPAFSADAAGVNVVNQPRWSGYQCCVIAGEHVLDFGDPCRRKGDKVKR